MRRRLLSIALTAFLVGAQASPAAADTFTPTRFDDPAPNGCKSQNCSLREAVLDANKSPGPTTIRLGRGTYILETYEDAGDPQRTGDLDVVDSAAILGLGPRRTTVSGEDMTRVFELGAVNRIGRPIHTLKGMTVRSGASGEDGGAILTGFSEARLKRLVVRDSTALRGGGVAAVRSRLTVTRSTFRGNTASYGGGLFFPAGFSSTEAAIKASTVSGNAAAVGGGLSLDGLNAPGAEAEPEVDVVNSTFAGNRASNSGGGISALNGATVSLDNSTVAYNEAQLEGSGGSGGGMSQASSATFVFADSILAANSVGSGGSHPQCVGTFAPDGGANLLANLSNDPCSIFGTVVADALIGPLAANGGPTKTIALLEGSAAIGLAQTCPKRDQRGETRPANCDTGAFERKGP